MWFVPGFAFKYFDLEMTLDSVQVRALACVIVLCSCARYFTLTVPPSMQEYKWVLATKCWRVTCDGLA